MKPEKKMPIPLSLIAIDGVGALLVAWGFYQYVSGAGGLLHIGAGFLLMMPLIIHILNLSKQKQQARKKD